MPAAVIPKAAVAAHMMHRESAFATTVVQMAAVPIGHDGIDHKECALCVCMHFFYCDR